MIKNQRQYQISKKQLDAFRDAASEARKQIPGAGQDEQLLRRVEVDAIASQVALLEEEISEYEALLSGKRRVLEVDSFMGLSTALIQARIAAGLSQKELAERLGLKEQQVQRYEATEYESASLSRINEIVAVLGLKVRKEILLPTPKFTLSELWAKLKNIGVSSEWVQKKLLPRQVSALMQEDQHGVEEPALAMTIAGYVGRVFGFSPAALVGGESLAIDGLSGQIARFKLPSNVKQQTVSAYVVYAHYLALLALQATDENRIHRLPEDWHDARKAVMQHYGAMNFRAVLRYVWDLGVVVLPLQDSGTFHGATWRVSGRNVVVIKQTNHSPARWLIDLLHEAFHALDKVEDADFAVIEEEEMSESRRQSPDEIEATDFATGVALDGRGEELAELCAHLSKGSVARLKSVVPDVAREAEVSVGVLANYIAHRLSAQGLDWWGAAQNLQERDEDPYMIARDMLLARLDFDRLNPMDQTLLSRALANPED